MTKLTFAGMIALLLIFSTACSSVPPAETLSASTRPDLVASQFLGDRVFIRSLDIAEGDIVIELGTAGATPCFSVHPNLLKRLTLF